MKSISCRLTASVLMFALCLPGWAQEDMHDLTYSETRRRSLALVELQRNHGLSYPDALQLANAELRARRAVELLGVPTHRVKVVYRDFLKDKVRLGDLHGPRIEFSPKFGSQSRGEIYSQFWRYYLERTYGSWEQYKIANFQSGLMFPNESRRVQPHLEEIGRLLIHNNGAVTPGVLKQVEALHEASRTSFRPGQLRPPHLLKLDGRVAELITQVNEPIRGATPPSATTALPDAAIPSKLAPPTHGDEGGNGITRKSSTRSKAPQFPNEARMWPESRRSPQESKVLESLSKRGRMNAGLLQIATYPTALLAQQFLRTVESSGSVRDFVEQVRTIDPAETAMSVAIFSGASSNVSALLSHVRFPDWKYTRLGRIGIRQGLPMALAMAAVDAQQGHRPKVMPLLRSTGSYMIAGGVVDVATSAVTHALRYTPQGWTRTFMMEASKAGLVLWLGDRLDRGVWTGNWKPSRSRFHYEH